MALKKDPEIPEKTDQAHGAPSSLCYINELLIQHIFQVLSRDNKKAPAIPYYALIVGSHDPRLIAGHILSIDKNITIGVLEFTAVGRQPLELRVFFRELRARIAKREALVSRVLFYELPFGEGIAAARNVVLGRIFNGDEERDTWGILADPMTTYDAGGANAVVSHAQASLLQRGRSGPCVVAVKGLALMAAFPCQERFALRRDELALNCAVFNNAVVGFEDVDYAARCLLNRKTGLGVDFEFPDAVRQTVALRKGATVISYLSRVDIWSRFRDFVTLYGGGVNVSASHLNAKKVMEALEEQHSSVRLKTDAEVFPTLGSLQELAKNSWLELRSGIDHTQEVAFQLPRCISMVTRCLTQLEEATTTEKSKDSDRQLLRRPLPSLPVSCFWFCTNGR